MGGDENLAVNALIHNDTGSQVQTIYTHDFAYLDGPLPGRHILRPMPVPITTPNGITQMPTVSMDIRIVNHDPNGEPKALTDWLRETFVIRDRVGDQTLLLSGTAMRGKLYFATAPGNDQLFVSVKKNGIVSQLPAV
ncbi:hypothetical protein IMZ48_21580 [Candidatus Bathyarchaeota archaeon]|nr:hypothetical protein [Candidatus Bathyarchaeota archaeon]